MAFNETLAQAIGFTEGLLQYTLRFDVAFGGEDLRQALKPTR
jgi:hypothetical protein